MNMGMRPHLAAPGEVEDAVESNGCPQAFWILPELQKGLGRILIKGSSLLSTGVSTGSTGVGPQ